jgi:hypothetical protein
MGYEQGATAQLDPTLVARPQVRHAVKKTVSGPIALCGAGRIEIRLLGTFDSAAESACPLCVQLMPAT